MNEILFRCACGLLVGWMVLVIVAFIKVSAVWAWRNTFGEIE